MPVISNSEVVSEAWVVWDQGRKRFRLGEGTFFLGRDPEACELSFDDQELSRRHALIVSSKDGYTLFDFRSTNGVFINTKQIDQYILKDGDVFRIGRQEIRFVQKSRAEPTIPRKTQDALRKAAAKGDAPGGLTQILKLDDLKSLETEEEEEVVDQGMLAAKLANLIKVSRIVNRDLSLVINGEQELGALLDKVVGLALEVLKANRGLLMLKNERTEELYAAAHRDMDHMVQGRPHVISQSIVKHTMASGTSTLTEDAFADSRFSLSASIQMYNIRSAICVPLKSRDKLLGVLYVDNRIESNCLNSDDLELLEAFADQVAGAVDNAQLAKKVQEESRKRDNLSRYLSPNIVKKIVDHRGQLELGGDKVCVTILFADIRGFTSFSEYKNPAIVVKFLNDFLSRMTQVVFERGGTLDKYLGDGLMAIFGAPLPLTDAPERAVEAGIMMQQVMTQHQERWAHEFNFTGQLGIGVNSGEVISGNIGSSQRMDYTVIGDAVNLAARLQTLSRVGDIVISEYTYEALKSKPPDIQELGLVPLKGKSKEVRVYRINVSKSDAD